MTTVAEMRYFSRTGEFCISPGRSHFGYAGYGPGRNAPALQHVKNIGPPPEGRYALKKHWRDRAGPFTTALEPAPGTRMYGRSGFLIHGDNANGTASRGCIILPRDVREGIAIYVAEYDRVWLFVIA